MSNIHRSYSYLSWLPVGNIDPADNTDYFLVWYGLVGSWAFPVTMENDATIVGVQIQTVVAGTLGSSENVAVNVRVNDSSDSSVGNMQLDAIVETQVFTGLSISVSAGDEIMLKFSTPAWVTNPTVVLLSARVIVENT